MCFIIKNKKMIGENKYQNREWVGKKDFVEQKVAVKE